MMGYPTTDTNSYNFFLTVIMYELIDKVGVAVNGFCLFTFLFIYFQVRI